MFIADMYRNFHILKKLKDKDITIVVHDPGEIFEENEDFLKIWNIIVIRKSVQDFLERECGIKAKFLYHPFYPYKIINNNTAENNVIVNKKEAVSISRIDVYKNIDILLNANKKLDRPIKIYGLVNPQYVLSKLSKLDFDKHYCGMFDKSFSQVSNILSKSKFMADLSELHLMVVGHNTPFWRQYTTTRSLY